MSRLVVVVVVAAARRWISEAWRRIPASSSSRSDPSTDAQGDGRRQHDRPGWAALRTSEVFFLCKPGPDAWPARGTIEDEDEELIRYCAVRPQEQREGL